MRAAHSYPYLRLSQIFQEDYSDVLLMAQYEQRLLREGCDISRPHTVASYGPPTRVEFEAIDRLIGEPENMARYAALRDEVVLSVREFAVIQREGWD